MCAGELQTHPGGQWAISVVLEPLGPACSERPHLAWHASKEYFEAFPLTGIVRPEVLATDLEEVPAAGKAIVRPDGEPQGGQGVTMEQGYLAIIAFPDTQIVGLLIALDASAHAKVTIIGFGGDHGLHPGQKERWRKFALWEEATRVPLLVVAPGGTSLPACNAPDAPRHKVAEE